MTVIPRVQMVYRIEFFKGEELFDSRLVKPEHIHYWIADYSDEGLRVVYNRAWVSPDKFAEI